HANQTANSFNKKVSIAILDASGTTILITRGDKVGPHNTEASRRKAFTALSTKTPTLELLRNADANLDTKNLNSLPELLLLSGGVPIWYKGNIIGSIGVSGGGSPENDDLIAKSAAITELGITTTK
ncbi:heme-binding protein, partial [Algoriella sp.]|uniref:heme-binding protein n=1 Tax=Algoriella sp. TaxID=1872434 RepID=UPI001B1FA842